ncbi:hypothetical protein Tco_0779656 [Tanacetum coccineum]
MRNKSVNDVVFNKEARHLSFFDIQIFVSPMDVERASSVVEGCCYGTCEFPIEWPCAPLLIVMGPYLILIGESFDSVKYTLEIVYSELYSDMVVVGTIPVIIEISFKMYCATFIKIER